MPTETTPSDLMIVKEAAVKLQMSEPTVYRRAMKGQRPHIRLFTDKHNSALRFSRKALDKFLESRSVSVKR